MRYVVSYDVSSDKRRKKLSDHLSGVLTRVQLSVFEGDVPSEFLKKAIDRALPMIDAETDSLRVYHLCAACAPRVYVYGKGLAVTSEPVRVL